MEGHNLPQIGPLRSSKCGFLAPAQDEPDSHHMDSAGPSCDNSPRVAAEEGSALPQVPINSVYRLTKLSALRSPDTADLNTGRSEPESSIDDLISHGFLSYEDAERLFMLYVERLDFFMYAIGGRYKTLNALRRSSRILAVCIFTVAALHDGQGNGSLYGTCMKEFRRVMAASIFSRQIDRDYLRAMCIASYWLSDMSWTLSGYGIRRAAELNLSRFHHRAIVEEDADAVDSVRIWYLLYICDQHLSTLYGRQPIIQNDPAVQGWDVFVQRPAATDEDRRLASQVALSTLR